MNIKVLRIIARLNIGGPARNAVLLTKGLSHSKDNFNCETILVCGQVDGNEGDMMYLAKEKGIEPVIVKELGRNLSLKNDWQAFWKIYKIICREKPDIIHTHTAKAGTLGRMAGILYNARLNGRVRLVHTFHGHVLHSYFGKARTWFFIWIEKILALFTDKIIAVSGSLKKELIERFRIAPEKKFSVIELGLEMDELLNLPVRESPDCVNIGIVGRLAPVKNHRMLFRVISNIRHRTSGIRLRLIVIGDGELRQDLEGYAKELGIQDMVDFKGWIKDLGNIYKALDIVALTSMNEGTPVSIIEGMAAARPVVATEVGGVSDIVQDGRNGYLVKPEDDEEFAKKLLDLIRNPGKRKILGEYGRMIIRDRFSSKRLVDDTGILYRNLIKIGGIN